MSEREKELFLFDILIAIEKIKDITKNYKNADDLVFNYRDWDSVIREFEIIGEAMKKCIDFGIFKNDKEKRKVIDFRNILIHKYFGIDEEEVWQVIKNLDILENEILDVIKIIDKTKIIENLKLEYKNQEILEYLEFLKGLK